MKKIFTVSLLFLSIVILNSCKEEGNPSATDETVEIPGTWVMSGTPTITTVFSADNTYTTTVGAGTTTFYTESGTWALDGTTITFTPALCNGEACNEIYSGTVSGSTITYPNPMNKNQNNVITKQ